MKTRSSTRNAKLIAQKHEIIPVDEPAGRTRRPPRTKSETKKILGTTLLENRKLNRRCLSSDKSKLSPKCNVCPKDSLANDQKLYEKNKCNKKILEYLRRKLVQQQVHFILLSNSVRKINRKKTSRNLSKR